MVDNYNIAARKRAVSLVLDEGLVARARTQTPENGLSARVERLLAADLVVQEEQASAKAKSLKSAASAWDVFLEEHGSFADDFSTL